MIRLLVLAPLALVPAAQADPSGQHQTRPCFNVDVQNDRVNQNTVQQDCDRNFNRTVQSGQQNRAQTVQTGDVNSNRTRQYRFDPPMFGERLRGD
jgi:hypothetical protein